MPSSSSIARRLVLLAIFYACTSAFVLLLNNNNVNNNNGVSFFAAAAASAEPVLADDGESEDAIKARMEEMAKAEEELEKKLGIKFRNPDVTFNSTLPNNAFNMIGYGEQTAVNIQMINSGKTNYSISVISGVLVNPQNTSQVIANLTAFQYGTFLGKKSNISLPYSFVVSMEPPVDVGVLVFVDYVANNADKTKYRSVAYQDVVKVVYTDSAFDLQSIILYIIGLAFAAGILVVTKNAFLGPAPKKRTSKVTVPASSAAPVASKETGTMNRQYSDEWIPDHVKRATAGANPSGKGLKKRK